MNAIKNSIMRWLSRDNNIEIFVDTLFDRRKIDDEKIDEFVRIIHEEITINNSKEDVELLEKIITEIKSDNTDDIFQNKIIKAISKVIKEETDNEDENEEFVELENKYQRMSTEEVCKKLMDYGEMFSSIDTKSVAVSVLKMAVAFYKYDDSEDVIELAKSNLRRSRFLCSDSDDE